MSPINIRVLQDFDHPLLASDQWSRLLTHGTNKIFQSWHWQRAWWDSFGRGDLLLTLVERDGKPAALAPLFADEGMVFFVGSGGSDYLDFIGDLQDSRTVGRLLSALRTKVPGFVGFRFYHVLDESDTPRLLRQAADDLDLDCFDEGESPAPFLSIAAEPEQLSRAIRKKSLVRHDNFFHRTGEFQVERLSCGTTIMRHLDAFFDQHVQRWAETPYPSLFEDVKQRDFYRRLTQLAADTGWLRFTRAVWAGKPVAFHYGFCYGGEYLWYKPSFDISLARRSPGEVLLRHLLMAAGEECADVFDFGLGDEDFKHRFATGSRTVRTWGLYPSEQSGRESR